MCISALQTWRAHRLEVTERRAAISFSTLVRFSKKRSRADVSPHGSLITVTIPIQFIHYRGGRQRQLNLRRIALLGFFPTMTSSIDSVTAFHQPKKQTMWHSCCRRERCLSGEWNDPSSSAPFLIYFLLKWPPRAFTRYNSSWQVKVDDVGEHLLYFLPGS